MTAAITPGSASNWKIMGALLRKDWRLFRLPMLGLLLLTAACYVIAFIASYYSSPPDENHFSDLFLTASVAAIGLVPLMATVFGGAAIAGERSDRTADFLAMLPVSRRQIIASKWLLSIVVLAVFCAVDAGIALTSQGIHLSRPYYDGHIPNISDIIFPVNLWFALSISFYGVAWLLSTFTRSEPISACGSIAVTILLTIAVAVFVETHTIAFTNTTDIERVDFMGVAIHLPGIHNLADLELFLVVCCTTLVGMISLIGGTVYYLKRVAP